MSNFEKVIEFNKAFEIITNNEPSVHIFDSSKKLIDYRLSLILEEVKELQDAIKEKDLTETIDALTDILYVTLGAFTALGVNADVAFDIVHKSNMSKLCATELEAIETVNFYKLNQNRYDTPSYKKSVHGPQWIVYNKSTMKILKSIYYMKANFESIL